MVANMKVKLFNKAQLLRKQVILPMALAIVVIGGGSAYALHADASKPALGQAVASVASTDTQPTDTSISTTTTSTAEPVSTPTPTPTSTTPPTPPANPYQNGFDAWYVFNRRSDVGKTMPDVQAVNVNYCSQLAAQSITVSSSPSQYAIACSGTHHVSFVEQVNSDGSIWISEMNGMGQKSMTDTTSWGGWGRTDYKLVAAENLAAYQFVE